MYLSKSARKLDPQKVQRQITANVLTAGTLRDPSEQILNCFGLAPEFKVNPKKVIFKIHGASPVFLNQYMIEH